MEKKLLLNKITFKKDFRTFKEGDTIDIKKPLLVLVGLNACGKSTILDCLREEFKIDDDSYLKGPPGTYKEAIRIEKSDKKFDTRYFDFHSGDKKYSGSFGNDMSGQMSAMRASSGLGSIIQFNNTKIKNLKDSLIMLDEPDRGMALKLQMSFADMFLKMVFINGNQMVISTHSTYIMDVGELIGQIYSVEHKRFFDTKKEFLDEHLKGY